MLLYVYTPWVFAYHTADLLRRSEQVRWSIMFVVESEMGVFAFFVLLAGASEGILFSRTKDPREYGYNEYRIGRKENKRERGRLV